MAHYGSSDSGASLGDILGAAIRKAGGDEAEEGEANDSTLKAESEDIPSDDSESHDGEAETTPPEKAAPSEVIEETKKTD